MNRLQQPTRGFTLAEAVELFRRLSAANDHCGHDERAAALAPPAHEAQRRCARDRRVTSAAAT
jgi:hypothetical protein